MFCTCICRNMNEFSFYCLINLKHNLTMTTTCEHAQMHIKSVNTYTHILTYLITIFLLQVIGCFCVASQIHVVLKSQLHEMQNFAILYQCICPQNVQQLVTKYSVKGMQLIHPCIQLHHYHKGFLTMNLDYIMMSLPD